MAHSTRRRADAWLASLDCDRLCDIVATGSRARALSRKGITCLAGRRPDSHGRASGASGYGVYTGTQGGESYVWILPIGPHLSLVPRRDALARRRVGARHPERPYPRLL